MEFYSLDQLWLCKIATVERERDILILCEDCLRTYLLISELTDKSSKVLDFSQIKDRKNQPDYHNLYGQECFSGTQRIMFTPKDIGKIFVMELKKIPEEYFTEEEKKSNEILKERVLELAQKLKYLQWQLKKETALLR